MQPDRGALELVSSQQVHRILRPAIESALFPMGFARTGPSPPGARARPKGWWTKVREEQFAIVWLQLEQHYGFSRHWGGRFTLNFEISRVPIALGLVLPKPDRPFDWRNPPPQPVQFQKRWWRLLDRTQRRRALELQRRVVARLPPPPAHIKRVFGSYFAPPWYFPWEEIWGRYASVDDVKLWAVFLQDSMTSTTSRFLEQARRKVR